MHIRVGLIGDYDESVTAHRAIPRALELASAAVGVDVEHRWIHTTALGTRQGLDVMEYDALWCVPASPYADTDAVLRAIGLARDLKRPFLGTCGGFQHALLEYARAKWGIENPAHAETDPDAEELIISPLECALIEQTGAIRFAPGSRIANAYGEERAIEGYHCRYGLNDRYAVRLIDGPLRATGWDESGDVRCIELDEHPFFVATLFQPERAALENRVPPIVQAFLEAAVDAS